jgi:plastocyanin
MSNHTRIRTPLTFLVGLVCIVAFAAACSSDSGSKASTSSSSTASSAGSASSTSGSSGSASSAPAASGTDVTIKDFKFSPETLSVKVGDKVTFKNSDGQPHTATSDNSGDFDAGAVDPGSSKVVTFDKAGTFTYHCSFHPFMHGTIEVK